VNENEHDCDEDTCLVHEMQNFYHSCDFCVSGHALGFLTIWIESLWCFFSPALTGYSHH
jgi:hypothetical protein